MMKRRLEECAAIRSLRSSARWQHVRAGVLRDAHGLCFFCGNLAEEVHHIEPATTDNFFEFGNLVALCIGCHDKVHASYNMGITWAQLTAARKR